MRNLGQMTKVTLWLMPTLIAGLSLVVSGALPLPAVAQVEKYPPPMITSIYPTSGEQRQTLEITISGHYFQNGAKASLPPTGITITSVNFISPMELRATITIAKDASVGPRDVTLTNPDGKLSTLKGGFTVVAHPAVVLAWWGIILIIIVGGVVIYFVWKYIFRRFTRIIKDNYAANPEAAALRYNYPTYQAWYDAQNWAVRDAAVKPGDP